VIGAHSSSIGKIDQDKLFYLLSRGFDAKSDKKLVVESSFGPVFDAIVEEYIVVKLKEISERSL
ncbi:SufD family Fe-S cluster assembly protein, partial [Streptobacillus felis]|uniref:SufD family Fe-S cluster assembly protein n=1 Tax=Streptobacillus felis TaxID=1384509 RepID=UPI000ACA1C82